MENRFTDQYKDVIDEMLSIIQQEGSFLQLDNIQMTQMIYEIQKLVGEDVLALASKDPAALNSADYVKKAYNSIKAVMYYRIANYIYKLKDTITDIAMEDYNNEFSVEIQDEINQVKQIYIDRARRISEIGKALTQIEIHPAAKIGHSFVIDHGVGTVIGETSEIGDNCYLLQGVILGASGIGNNHQGKRHPTLGNNVEIGACARIIGPVKVGNNVKVNSYCIVSTDIPSNCVVSIVNQLQVTRIINKKQNQNSNLISIYGIEPQKKYLSVRGRGLDKICSIDIIKYPEQFGINETINPIDGTECIVKYDQDIELKITISGIESIPKVDRSLALVLYYSKQEYLIVTNSRGLYDYVNQQ